MTRALVLSGQGRWHLGAEQLPAEAGWLGACGSRITQPQDEAQYDAAVLTTTEQPVCAYCRAIAVEVVFAQQLAAEAIADAEHYWMRRSA